MTVEKITDLAEFLKENACITQPEDSFATILITLVRIFKSVLSVREMAYSLNSMTAQILSDEDSQIRENYPQGPGIVRPENN